MLCSQTRWEPPKWPRTKSLGPPCCYLYVVPDPTSKLETERYDPITERSNTSEARSLCPLSLPAMDLVKEYIALLHAPRRSLSVPSVVGTAACRPYGLCIREARWDGVGDWRRFDIDYASSNDRRACHSPRSKHGHILCTDRSPEERCTQGLP